MSNDEGERRRPVGATVLARGGVEFRVWAPARRGVEVVLEGGPGDGRTRGLEPEDEGYHAARIEAAGPGTLYRYRLDGEEPLRADPASRFQPEGPHGPSQVIEPGAYRWTDRDWRGPEAIGAIIYELHVGTFTREGTWRAARKRLPALAELGVTVLEILPVADFPGRFGWGYDAVNLFAPSRLYGTPDDMRKFVDVAHGLGLAVIMDVCYNHLGPDGNVLPEFSPQYFSKTHLTEWGVALNFDGEYSGPVRAFVLANVACWIGEYHLDGLRVDASQSVFDDSPGEHILAAITRQARAVAGSRRTLLVAENEPQHVALLKPPEEGGQGFDVLWTEDWHHIAILAATGRREGYYRDYRGTPQEFISAAKYGVVYQGQFNPRQGKRRGSPAFGVRPGRFVAYLQNHDQVANAPRSVRCHHQLDPGHYRALTALLLLGPCTPMLFQGQEFAASNPFCYFGDLRPEIAVKMHQGRRDFLSQFRSLAMAEMEALVPKSSDPETFARSKLDWSERDRPGHAEALALHRDLIKLRREDPIFARVNAGAIDGAVLDREAFALRYFGTIGDDRLLVVNLGPDLVLDVAPEPLMAPPEGAVWDLLWSSENPRYGGTGTAPLESPEGQWQIPGHAVVALVPRASSERSNPGRAPATRG